jgi:hypothetical protein
MTTRQRREFGTIRRMRSGRFQASYTGPDGTRHKHVITFVERRDAEAWLAAERRKIERSEWQAPGAGSQHDRAAVLIATIRAAVDELEELVAWLPG